MMGRLLTLFVLLTALCVVGILNGARRRTLPLWSLVGGFVFSGAGLVVWALVVAAEVAR